MKNLNMQMLFHNQSIQVKWRANVFQKPLICCDFEIYNNMQHHKRVHMHIQAMLVDPPTSFIPDLQTSTFS